MSDTKEETAEGEEKPKKKRKKKAKAREGVPAFASRFPKNEALDALLAAFERGDYATVRKDGAALAKSAEEPRVKQAAEELLRRIEPDPLAKMMVLAASLLLAFFAVWYFSHRISP